MAERAREQVNPHLQQWIDQQQMPPGSKYSVPLEDWQKSKGEWEDQIDYFGGVPGNMTNPIKAYWRMMSGDRPEYQQLDIRQAAAERKRQEEYGRSFDSGAARRAKQESYAWQGEPGRRPHEQEAMELDQRQKFLEQMRMRRMAARDLKPIPYGTPMQQEPGPTLGLPSLEDIQIGQPRNRWFGVPERPMTENEFRNMQTLPWNPPASMRQSQMTQEQLEEIMRQQSLPKGGY